MALPVTAGRPATYQQFNALVPTYMRQASDQALATTTSTNHNTFAAIPVLVGEVWHVTVLMQTDTANAGNDIKVRWQMTGGVAFSSRRFISAPGLNMAQPVIGGATIAAGSGGPVEVAGHWQARADTDSVSGGASTDASIASFWREEFVLSGVGTDGTYTLQWAQSTATSGVTTVRAGSFLIARRLA